MRKIFMDPRTSEDDRKWDDPMLDGLAGGFKAAKNLLKGERQLTEANIEAAVKQVRQSLLEADVAFPVVKAFTASVTEKAVGQSVKTQIKSKVGKKLQLSPLEHFVGICSEELEALMGPAGEGITYNEAGITTVMMVGLQGAGKTTSVGKLARYLLDEGKKPLLVAADIYRPAAVHQLKVLGDRLGVPVYTREQATPPQLCSEALEEAKRNGRDVVIFDTAGRLAVDEPLMAELDDIKTRTNPDNVFLVVDAMIGQDAVNTAKTFNDRLEVDGFIMTKLDGDARGGAALSIKYITGKPIQFLGMGENLDNLEVFRPQGLASRILGMGDIVGLAQDFQKHVDEEKAEKDAERMLKGQFTMTDFLDQIKMIQKMGSLKDVMGKMPGMADMMGGKSPDDSELTKIESMVLSMTPKERLDTKLFSAQSSRIRRVAKGSGRPEKDVAGLLQRFGMMKQMMGAVGQNPGLLGRIPGMKNIAQMGKIAKAYKGGANPLADIMGPGGMPSGGMGGIPGMHGMGASKSQHTKSAALSGKAKKDKRKSQKKARQKNKKKR